MGETHCSPCASEYRMGKRPPSFHSAQPWFTGESKRWCELTARILLQQRGQQKLVRGPSHHSTETGRIRTYLIWLYSSWNTAPGRRGLPWSVHNFQEIPVPVFTRAGGWGQAEQTLYMKNWLLLQVLCLFWDASSSWLFTSSFCIFSFNKES